MEQNKPTILIVDDNPVNTTLLKILLKKEGYATIAADNGIKACQIAQAGSPDLMLLDIMMPDMDGFEVCQKLQADTATTDIPIIFLSGMDDIESKVKAFGMGAVDYISKPFQRAEVLARVRLHLKLSMSSKAALAMQAEKFGQIRNAQQAILVSPKDIPQANFGVQYDPILEAGGDFYDVIAISDDIFGYFVADVSGHDLGASFTTPAIKALLSQHSSPVYTPKETMKHINGVLNTMLTDGNHITAAYAKLNRSKGLLEIINAAHPPIVYLSADGEVEPLETTGDVVGVFDKVCFEPIEKAVSEGDRFFLYTDGLIEKFSHSQSRTEGLDQLTTSCKETAELPIEEAVSRICSDIIPDQSVLEDDVVLLGVEV